MIIPTINYIGGAFVCQMTPGRRPFTERDLLKIFLTVIIALAAAHILPLLIYAILLLTGALFVDPDREYENTPAFYRFLVTGAVFLSVKLLWIRPRLYGKEKLPEGPYLLVGNHRSGFDPLATLYVLRDPRLVFIAKPSIKRVPGVGKVMQRSLFMFIDRDNPRNAIKTIGRAAELLGRGHCVGVYPEGTRGDGKELLPFHNGVFKAAQKAGVPIVVAAISGTEKTNGNFPRRATPVRIEITECISAGEVSAMRTAEISERVKKSLEKALDRKEETK